MYWGVAKTPCLYDKQFVSAYFESFTTCSDALAGEWNLIHFFPSVSGANLAVSCFGLQAICYGLNQNRNGHGFYSRSNQRFINSREIVTKTNASWESSRRKIWLPRSPTRRRRCHRRRRRRCGDASARPPRTLAPSGVGYTAAAAVCRGRSRASSLETPASGAPRCSVPAACRGPCRNSSLRALPAPAF